MEIKEIGLVLAPTELTEIKEQVSIVEQNASSLVVSDQKSLDLATEALHSVSQAEKFIVNRKQEITSPLMKSLASVRDLFKPLETSLLMAKSIIKGKMLEYQLAEEERINKEKERITKRVEKGTMKAETAAGKLETVGEAPKSNIRTVKKVRVTDENLIPREYLMPDIILITEFIIKKGVTIPGAEMYVEKSIISR